MIFEAIVSFLSSIPLLVVAVQLARDNILGGFVAMFFGMFFLNTNWSVDQRPFRLNNIKDRKMLLFFKGKAGQNWVSKFDLLIPDSYCEHSRNPLTLIVL